ncbi:MAG: selenocysteine-specific translation elongation factor [Acidobacteria bacterium]|nr:selenocysteine-specific translation elongation factor [Acidobacteriota bacterium]
MQHVVVGTAGHIDHGKSALVQALTGTDPDRLREEKARGITIDLGFAHTVEDGIALSFVDVPGHERFVRNMLAGVGGMDLVMLHVAADESVMPQTREHFEICRLLRVPAGLVVITKSDLSDDAMLDVVRLEVEELVAGSFLEGAPVLAVSARSGSGLENLRLVLARLATSVRRRASQGPPRLPVDRVFSMKGFGTVATGTLLSGRLAQDEDLVLQPSGRTVKVRGLQVHGALEAEALAGQRAAVNIAGLEVADVSRGETLTRSGAVTVTRHVDVRVELLESARPLRHGGRVRFHQGTRELLGRVALSEGPHVEPGACAFARIHLEAPAVLVRGDRFILRAYSPLSTIAGGTVLDPSPPRRGVRTAAGAARFARLSEADAPDEAVMGMVEEAGLAGLPVGQLASRAGVPVDECEALEARLVRDGQAARIGAVLVAASRLSVVEPLMLDALKKYHARHPLEDGMPREELRERLFAGAPVSVYDEALRRLVAGKAVVARERVALAGHAVALTDEEARARDVMLDTLRTAALAPPDPAALARAIGVSPEVVNRMGVMMGRRGVLVRAGDLLFDAPALDRLKIEVHALKQNGTGTLDVATFKKHFDLTRKYAILLLEYLDRERVTRRVGDLRRIL